MGSRRNTAAAIRARLSRHWVARLRREKTLEALEHAATLGVLERVEHPHGFSLFRQGMNIAGWTIDRVRMLVRQAFGARSPGVPHENHPRTTASGSTWDFVADDDLWGVPLFDGGGPRKAGAASGHVWALVPGR